MWHLQPQLKMSLPVSQEPTSKAEVLPISSPPSSQHFKNFVRGSTLLPTESGGGGGGGPGFHTMGFSESELVSTDFILFWLAAFFSLAMQYLGHIFSMFR